MPSALKTPAPALRLFCPRPPVGSDQIDVVGLGSREWMAPGLVDRPRGTDDWLLMAFPTPVIIGEGNEVVVAPALVLWQPLAPHRYGDPNAPWCHSWMHLTGAAVERLVRLAGLPVDAPVTGIDVDVVDRCIGDLHREIDGERPDPVIAECLLRILLHQTARRIRGGAAAAPAPGLIAARRRLEERFAAPFHLADVARLAGLSPNHFCTAFHRAFGLSPHDFVLRVRLEHARVLLRDRNRSVAEVAAAVGYADPASFARLVRRRFGHGPSALR